MPDTIQAPPEIAAPRVHSKTHRLLTLLKSSSGASLDDMTEATGWLPHTIRAAMTGLRKRGYQIERHVEGSVAVWSIMEADA